MERRVEMWRNGDIRKLLREAESIQKKMKKKVSNSKETDKVKKFTNLMGKGKIAKAVRELTTEGMAGTLPLNEATT